MFSYLYKNQKCKFSILIFFSIMSNLFEIGLAYVMLSCVEFAMNGNLPDAMFHAFWLLIYIIIFFLVDLISKKIKCKRIIIRRIAFLPNLLHNHKQEMRALYCNYV